VSFRIDSAKLVDGQSVDVVHERLRTAILRGELAPGAELSQVQLAGDLGVSRTPLREAIRMLLREGLVEGEPNKRVRVAGLSAADMEQLYTMRITLEVLGVRLTVPQREDEDVAALEGQMTQMAFFAEREDYARYQVPHRAFHDALVAKAGPRIVQQLDELSDHCERYRRLHTTQWPHAWERGMQEHRAILDAWIAGEEELAAGRLAAHLAHTVIDNLELLDPDYEPVALRRTLRALPEMPSSEIVG
jgi:DNA-binding GntR family transcriptional regulator